MHLLLIAGFLGSGKTTLIIRLARAARESGRRVAILVNEIGEIGIDDQLMRQLALDVWELVSGCICCTLSGDLINTLQMLDREYAPDLVVLEPSGVAEPGNILKMLPYYRGRPLASVRSITLIDPLRLSMLYEVLTPLITAQIQRADMVLVTKTDVASAEEIAQARQIASELNPAARIFCTSVKEQIEPKLISELLQ
jgi:G3E family GTPase